MKLTTIQQTEQLMMHITIPFIMDNQVIIIVITTAAITLIMTTLILHRRIVSVMPKHMIAIHTLTMIIILRIHTRHIRPQLMMLATVWIQEITSMDTISDMMLTLFSMWNTHRLLLLK